MKKFIFLICLISHSACEWESSSENDNIGFAKTLTEEQVLDKTMKDFVGEVKTQDDIDRNLILNHIIDNKLDMKSSPSGIYYQITKEGTGVHPTLKDDVILNYHGTFLNGKIFDSKMDPSKPFIRPLGRLINGWKKALPMIKIGSKAIFIIPSSLCYGETGLGEMIPPNTILKFEMHLMGTRER